MAMVCANEERPTMMLMRDMVVLNCPLTKAVIKRCRQDCQDSGLEVSLLTLLQIWNYLYYCSGSSISRKYLNIIRSHPNLSVHPAVFSLSFVLNSWTTFSYDSGK